MKMPKMFTVVTTARDIRNGTPRDTETCPVARALKRKFGVSRKQNVISVTPGGFSISVGGKFYIYRDRTSKNKVTLQHFVEKFDTGHKVKTTKFFFTLTGQ